MKALTFAKTNEWLVGFPVSGIESVRFDEHGLFFVHPEANCIDLEYPSKLERLPFFARYLAAVNCEESDFEGALIWITEWGVWSSPSESVGYRIVEGLNRGAGQMDSFESAPGHLFRSDEFVEAAGMLLQPMIFGWDAFYFPWWSHGQSQFFLHVSHDSFVSVVTLTKQYYELAFGHLKAMDFNPQHGHEKRLRRFCRPT